MDGGVEEGESGRGTAEAGAIIARGDGMDAACLDLISTPLSVRLSSERMDEVLDEPSFDRVNVSSNTLAY